MKFVYYLLKPHTWYPNNEVNWIMTIKAKNKNKWTKTTMKRERLNSKSFICTGIGHCPSTGHSYLKATHHEWNNLKEERFPLWLPRTPLCLWSGWRFSVAGPSRTPPSYFFYLLGSCLKYRPIPQHTNVLV